MGHVITIITVRMACGDCYVMIALPVSLALGERYVTNRINGML